MKRKFLFPNVIRVNKARNYITQKANNYPRYGSNDKNETFNNFYIMPKFNNNNYNINNLNDYATLTLDNYNRKKIKHYQSKDSLNDQLKLIKFKMSCDLIGQKLNQLKSFVDDIEQKDDEKEKKVNLKSNIISFNYLNSDINNNKFKNINSCFSLNNNANTSINNNENFCFNSYDNKNEIRKFNSKPLLTSKFMSNKFYDKKYHNLYMNKNKNTLNNIYQYENYFTDEENKNKIFNKTSNNNLHHVDNRKYKYQNNININNLNNIYKKEKETHFYEKYSNKDMNQNKNQRNKMIKNLSPYDNYFLSKDDEINASIYLTKNKNYQINSVMNNINLNINQNQKNDNMNNKQRTEIKNNNINNNINKMIIIDMIKIMII